MIENINKRDDFDLKIGTIIKNSGNGAENLFLLANLLKNKAPIYLVGGAVRNAILNIEISDFDICSELLVEEVKSALIGSDISIVGEYPRTGTLILKKGKFKCEYTTFRQDSYPINSGKHTPASTYFTKNIYEDACRRDFTCNAVYYDLLNCKLVNPILGLENIINKILVTTRDAKIVLGEDGLRILRLIRFSVELGFSIEKATYNSAIENNGLLKDIAVERITEEFNKILLGDIKYPNFSAVSPYDGMKMLIEIGAMEYIIPELLDCMNIEQNAKYHAYDVLEHILQTVKVAPPQIRLAGLFHDIAKPLAQKTYGDMHRHDNIGEMLTKNIMNRLKYPKEIISRVSRLVSIHMFDQKGDAKLKTIRMFIAENYDILDDFISLREADKTASGKRTEQSLQSLENIKKEYDFIKINNIPLIIKDMDIKGEDLIKAGYKGVEIKIKLKELLDYQIKMGVKLTREELIKQL